MTESKTAPRKARRSGTGSTPSDLKHLLVQPVLSTGHTSNPGGGRVAAREVVDELFGGLAVSVPSADAQRMQRAIALFWDSARAFGYAPPEPFSFQAGELFYRDGLLEEVRLRGLIAKEEGSVEWVTPVPPSTTYDAQLERAVTATSDAERSHIVAVLSGEGELPGIGATLGSEPSRPAQTNSIAESTGLRLYLWYGLHAISDEDAATVVQPELIKAGEVLRSDDYVLYTSQEFDALQRAACDGQSGQNYLTDAQAGTRTHHVEGLPHAVQLALTPEEIAGGLGVASLEHLARAQNADATFALMYVSRLLAPPSPLPTNAYAGGWITLDDVIAKIGWKPRSTGEREEMRSQVWEYLRFGARARVIGSRNGIYRDPEGREIPTRVEGALWALIKEEKTVEPQLFPDAVGGVPVRVELVISKEWTRLITAPETAQYLPMGELLGSIKPDQASGAWARVLGLSLANFWRRQPHAALDGAIRPTRRELLDRYQSKVAPYEEILASNDPKRAVKYWFGALQILVEKEFVAREGEATRSINDIMKDMPRYGWHEAWLNESVWLRPGPVVAPSVIACVNSLPMPKPRQLKSPKKRGRPKKVPATA